MKIIAIDMIDAVEIITKERMPIEISQSQPNLYRYKNFA